MKIVVLILIIILLGSSNAETSKEITFRGIEWGSTVDYALNDALSDVRWGNAYAPQEVSSNDFELIGDKKGVESYHGKICLYYSSFQPGNITVAGYTIDRLELRFVLVPESNNLIIDNDHTSFYFASYELIPSNIDVVYDDLTDKLKTLYGDNYSEVDIGGFSKRRIRYWIGLKDTVVSLLYENGSSSRITISYGFLGSKELLQNAIEAYTISEQDRVAENTEGL